MANAVAPTSGTVVGLVGGVVGLGVHLVTGGGLAGSAATLWFAGACYVVAALLGTRLGKNLLGPFKTTGPGQASARARSNLAGELGDVFRGLLAGLRHLNEKRQAAYALGAVGVYRALYGVLFVQALLLYRNYFYSGGNGNKALGSVTLLVIASAVGFGLAAFITPQGVKRLTKDQWIAVLAADRRRGHDHPRPDLRQVHLPGPRLRPRPVRAVREDLRGHHRPADGGRRLHGPGLLAVRHALQRRLRHRPGDRHPVPAGVGQVLPGDPGHRRVLRRRERGVRHAHHQELEGGTAQSPPARPTQAAQR